MISPNISIARAAFAAIVACVGFAGCGDDPMPTTPTDSLTVPAAYSFESRFVSGTTSVNYPGQTVRNLQIQDLSTAIANLGKPGATAISEGVLLKYYEHSDADNITTLTSTGTLPAKVSAYSQIATGKNLSGKIAPEPVIGFDGTADALIREWIGVIAMNAQNPSKIGTSMVYTDADGRDLSQLVNKLLLGSVSYYQGVSVYMNGLMQKDNQVAAPGSGNATEAFSAMEHSWDEAFGYFGAARDYGRYSDADLAGAVDAYVFDSNGDRTIDFTSEYNFAFARGAGKRDAASAGRNLTGHAFDAFRRGRALIAARSTNEAILAERTKAVRAWEEVIAASVVHYINEVIVDMASLTSTSNASNSASLNKHWGEMKGYSLALQFSPFKSITTTQITTLQGYFGMSPVYALPGTPAHTVSITNLIQALQLLKNVYGFSDAEVAAW